MPRTMSKIKMDGFRAHSSAAISLLYLISGVSEWTVDCKLAYSVRQAIATK